MLQAHWIWKQFPRQIANDLSRFHHRAIREWHTGELSSYDLMVFLEFMPPESAFRQALRSDEYSEDQITWRHLANEVARLRATMHAVHGGQRYEPPLLLTRAEQADKIEELEATEERREDFFGFVDRTPKPTSDAQAPLDPDDLDWGDE